MTTSDCPLIKFIVPGDLHLTQPDLPNHRVANWVVDQANTLVLPDFVQFIGDNVQDATEQQFDLFDKVTRRLESRWFALVGDHDWCDDPQAIQFRQRYGDTWGSFRLRGFRFLRLNTQEAEPVGLSTAQRNWLRAELESAADADERIIVFQHNYAYQIWEAFDGPGISDWRRAIQSTRIEAVFAGHTLYWQVANDGHTVHVATRSIGDPEGGPAGYLLVVARGAELGMTYRTPEDVGPIVVILNPRQKLLCTGSDHVVSGQSQIAATILSRLPISSVTAQLDQTTPFALDQASDDIWNASFDPEPLAKGTHWLTVRASDQGGESSEQSIEFVVDQTGRYTAVPCTEPIVNSTNFC